MYKKIIISIFLISLIILSYSRSLDSFSATQLDKAFTRSVTVFAIARGLNGLISVVQGTEVYATPAGVGVNFSVGQIVDPMNDMVERFSWVMLLSSISLGVQEVMLHLGQTLFVQWLLIGGVLALLSMMWIPKLFHKQGFNAIFVFVSSVVFLRFLVPLLLLANEAVYTYVLEPKYEESKAALIFSNDEIQGLVNAVQLNQQKQVDMKQFQDDSLMQKAQRYVNETLQSLNVTKKLELLRHKFKQLLVSLEEKFDHAIDYILALITIFIVQNLLFPLLSLWLSYQLFIRFLRLDMASFLQKT